MSKGENIFFGFMAGIVATALIVTTFKVFKFHKEQSEEKSNFGLQGIELNNLNVKKK